jgi:hypothetical protein
MPQQTFSRKEVRELLKRQIKASAESYNRAGADKTLLKLCFSLYCDEITRTTKVLKNVNVIKF